MLLSALFKFLFCILILPTTLCSDEEDYYKLLGIDKSADLREIRKAFKKLAVQKHPDKNKDDPEAHANFVKLAEAYDTLKDPTKRNNYDLYGKQDSNNRSPPTYHSYSYYRDQFGIYDDDPLIATLSKDDMQSSIGDNIWFINFYSPLCSHCHTLAPEWRKLSELLEGVVKIGAINCEDERSLCWEISIGQFPTLLFFDERSTIYEGREYHGNRNAESMEKYIMSHISSIINVPNLHTLPQTLNTPWAIFLCPNDESCSNHYTQIKLAVVLKGLVSVGYFDDENLIEKITDGLEKPIDLIFYRREESKTIMQPLYGDDYNELTDKILHLLPEAPSLSQKEFQDARNELRINSDKPWLLCFTLAVDTQKILTLKKLVGILDNFKIGEINCGVNSGLCNSLHIVKYPTWGILKKGGAFEIHTGKSLSLHSIERFALDTYEATNIQALSPQDVQRIMSEGTPWLIGWLLTGCPPCKKLLPALRKASNHFAPDIIQFGTVDCAVHSATCSRHNVNSFPTTQIYNASSVITFQGDSNEDSIVEFVQTMSSNYVVTLNADNFADEVQPVDKNLDAYVVEFYAPWCAPCQRLQPEWMKLAQKLSDLKNIKIGAVNCEQEINFCRSEGVNSYPTIRLYPIKITSTGGAIVKFEGFNRDFASIRKWILSYLPSPIMILNTYNYNSEILSTKETRTWVIMYFAPWCGFCHTFEPEFFVAAQRLSQTVVAGKVDCQKEGALCQREGISSYPTVKLYQRIDGVTQLTNGINLDGFTQEALYTQMKTFAANAYITPVDHDEL